MTVDGFNEIFNTVYIAKKLFDLGKYDLVKSNFFDEVDYDSYYENMYGLIPNLFEHHSLRYYEHRDFELHILSDPVIVDFYKLAGQYGKRNNISDTSNSYIKEAEQIIRRELNFSYCLDWKLEGHTEPQRPYHSRIGLLIYHDDYVDLACLVDGLIEIYEWFSDTCTRLRDLLDDTMGGLQISLSDEVMAA